MLAVETESRIYTPEHVRVNLHFYKEKCTQCVNQLILIFTKTTYIFILHMSWAIKKVKCYAIYKHRLF